MSDAASPPFPTITKTWHNDTYPAIDPSRPEVSAKGKNIVITGGGIGIGATIAESFAQAGASNIGILGRREEHLKSTKQSIESRFPETRVYYAVADVTDESAINKAFDSFVSSFGGKIDYLISNAAYSSGITPIKDTTASEWWRAYEVNVLGGLIATQAFLKHAAEKDAVLVNVSTGAAHAGSFAGISSYASSKLASLKFFEIAQVENPNIRIISVHPGVIHESEMGAKAVQQGFILPPDTIKLAGHFIVWAASPEAAFLKGKLLWSNWDVSELKEKEGTLPESALATGLNGWGPALAAA